MKRATVRHTQSALGDTGAGAAIGAGADAAAGYNWQFINEKLELATKDSKLQGSEQRDGSLRVNLPGSGAFASSSCATESSLYPTLGNIASAPNDYPATHRHDRTPYRQHGRHASGPLDTVSNVITSSPNAEARPSRLQTVQPKQQAAAATADLKY